MLNRLYIENIAVIRRADIALNGALTVITGETGAGKSLLIDSVNAVGGQRVSKELIRFGENKAFVSAVFDCVPPTVRTILDESGYDCEDDELVLSREILSSGKSVARINGRPATAQLAQQIGELLINIHGQHDNQVLLNEARHTAILDTIGGYSELLES